MLVEIRDYTKIIQGVTVLDKVSLTLESGKIYGVKGKNGSGKTMLLRALAGLIYPTAGSLLIDGTPLEKGHFPPSVGALIETPSFVPNRTGLSNLLEISEIKGLISDQTVARALQAVGLDPKDPRPVRKYSLGMRQRLGIACAVMERPSLLLLDEPVNALDPAGVEMACRLFDGARRHGAIVVIACHDSEELEGSSTSASTFRTAGLSGDDAPMNKRKKKTRAVLAVLLAAFAALLYVHRFKEVNAGINYSVEKAQVGEPVQANLSGASSDSLSTITVASARELTPDELAELSARPPLEGYLDEDAHVVLILITTDDGEASTAEATTGICLQSGVTSWQCDPMIGIELAEDPLSTIESGGAAIALAYLVSPARSGGQAWADLNNKGFSLVTSTWPQRVSVELGRIEPWSLTS